MDSISTDNTYETEKSLKIYRNNSSTNLYKFQNILKPCPKKYRSNSFNKQMPGISGHLINGFSSKLLHKSNKSINCVKKPSRKDIYGNIIEKGGKHKVSFKDSFKGKYLVEMTLIDVKQNSLRGKNYKSLTIFREARDKEEILCSGVCNIF